MTVTHSTASRVTRLEHENKERNEQLREWLMLAKRQRQAAIERGLRQPMDHNTNGHVIA